MSINAFFVPFSSAVDASFWHELSQRKLNEYRLDETPRAIHGYYLAGDSKIGGVHLCVDEGAFISEHRGPRLSVHVPGTLHLANSIEHFKEYDKRALLEEQTALIWAAIESGAALTDPSLLNRLLLLVFADLKKYLYYYWFAFPALNIDDVVHEPAVPVASALGQAALARLTECLNTSTPIPPAFAVTQDGATAPLADWTGCVMGGKVIVAFTDPSGVDHTPGWPLRNLIALLRHTCRETVHAVDVVCLRLQMRDGRVDASASVVLRNMSWPDESVYKSVGWEKNIKGKLGPRMISLAQSMDPARLAESAVDLNLRLMRWRILPTLDLDKIRATKCLLLGAGTLGCNVARCLMGWGVRDITFVDNATVSYSNPARQSLFVLADCLQGGKPKAEAAAAALKTIFPCVNSEGHMLQIPMPGHAVAPAELQATREAVDRLAALIAAHDVVFLLMDTRESRWLPTLMCQAKGKLTINAAMGFDSFLVMRHGMQAAPDSERLGCYFCNDVIAPTDSTKDRTLDQQCTVTRPGLSFMAAALATELCVSVLQHPDGPLVRGFTAQDTTPTVQESPLGVIPHQVRSFLSSMQFVMPVGAAYERCTACSRTVVERYAAEGHEFLVEAFNSPRYLEDLTGLTQMKHDADQVDFDMDSDMSGDDF